MGGRRTDEFGCCSTQNFWNELFDLKGLMNLFNIRKGNRKELFPYPGLVLGEQESILKSKHNTSPVIPDTYHSRMLGEFNHPAYPPFNTDGETEA